MTTTTVVTTAFVAARFSVCGRLTCRLCRRCNFPACAKSACTKVATFDNQWRHRLKKRESYHARPTLTTPPAPSDTKETKKKKQTKNYILRARGKMRSLAPAYADAATFVHAQKVHAQKVHARKSQRWMKLATRAGETKQIITLVRGSDADADGTNRLKGTREKKTKNSVSPRKCVPSRLVCRRCK